ncbi:MAG: acyl-CoA dehydratase activase [Planctomycetota bacterium]|nr:acyl-CoA dehydratase activase [Planctomycetota bacterium]
MIAAGIDGGSRAIKIVLLECATCKEVAAGVRDQGVDHDGIARDLFGELLKSAGLTRRKVARAVATGYTRNAITFADTTVTEITCHAVGVRHEVPDAATVVEIGGQDSKLLRLNSDGSVRDFAMNDRCLEVVAARLGTGLEGLGDLARAATSPAPISSMCVVFAETEIIGLLASGAKAEDIVAGVQASVASRVAAMVGREAAPPVIFTGGVALIPGMVDALASALKTPVRIAPRPQMTGALGAAMMACRQTCPTRGKRAT